MGKPNENAGANIPETNKDEMQVPEIDTLSRNVNKIEKDLAELKGFSRATAVFAGLVLTCFGAYLQLSFVAPLAKITTDIESIKNQVNANTINIDNNKDQTNKLRDYTIKLSNQSSSELDFTTNSKILFCLGEPRLEIKLDLYKNIRSSAMLTLSQATPSNLRREDFLIYSNLYMLSSADPSKIRIYKIPTDRSNDRLFLDKFLRGFYMFSRQLEDKDNALVPDSLDRDRVWIVDNWDQKLEKHIETLLANDVEVFDINIEVNDVNAALEYVSKYDRSEELDEYSFDLPYKVIDTFIESKKSAH